MPVFASSPNSGRQQPGQESSAVDLGLRELDLPPVARDLEEGSRPQYSCWLCLSELCLKRDMLQEGNASSLGSKIEAIVGSVM